MYYQKSSHDCKSLSMEDEAYQGANGAYVEDVVGGVFDVGTNWEKLESKVWKWGSIFWESLSSYNHSYRHNEHGKEIIDYSYAKSMPYLLSWSAIIKYR